MLFGQFRILEECLQRGQNCGRNRQKASDYPPSDIGFFDERREYRTANNGKDHDHGHAKEGVHARFLLSDNKRVALFPVSRSVMIWMCGRWPLRHLFPLSHFGVQVSMHQDKQNQKLLGRGLKRMRFSFATILWLMIVVSAFFAGQYSVSAPVDFNNTLLAPSDQEVMNALNRAGPNRKLSAR